MSQVLLFFALYLVTINAITFLAFRVDKERARQGVWRISERTLLALALVGGSPAAIFAQQRLRHKTRKQPFAGLLCAIPVLQFVAISVLVGR